MTYQPREGVDAKTRDGQRVINIKPNEKTANYPWSGTITNDQGMLRTWRKSGRYLSFDNLTSCIDLVADWPQQKEEPMTNVKEQVAEKIYEAMQWAAERSTTIRYDLIADWKETKEDETMKKFKDLTDEEKGALLLAHHNGNVVEYRDDNMGDWEHVSRDSSWPVYCCYRVRPKPKTQDTIPWVAIHSDYKWAARDKSGHVFVYRKTPLKSGVCFDAYGDLSEQIDQVLACYKRGTCDWQDSLQQRPDGV